MLIDSHSHIGMGEFDNDRDRVMERAREAGVVAIIDIGIDLASSEAAIDFADKYDDVFATVGIHPHDASRVTDSMIDRLEKLAKHPGVVAIGEIGLDFYRNRSLKEAQVESFKRQLDLASKLGLPVVIHSRNAKDEVFEILSEYVMKHRRFAVSSIPLSPPLAKGDTGRMPLSGEGETGDRPVGVLHCFSGDVEIGAKYIDMGFLVSFAGPVTYPKSSAASVARELPLDRMLVETDCPFLTPQVYRGKRNEPSYVSHVAAKIAEVKGVTVDAVMRATSSNAIRLFRLPIESER
ncbi:MAG: TatD family hydrolase [Chloroflexota bacterium]|nr:TatD family hydrolase [Chloroflexota bacterium]